MEFEDLDSLKEALANFDGAVRHGRPNPLRGLQEIVSFRCMVREKFG